MLYLIMSLLLPRARSEVGSWRLDMGVLIPLRVGGNYVHALVGVALVSFTTITVHHECQVMANGGGGGGSAAAPAMFVFGDSLFDPGNNLKLVSLARAAHKPYGRDFPSSHLPTGRFCNGLLSSDILASLAGLPYPPAYLLLTEQDNLLRGCSFASAGAGILNLTGYQQIQRISFLQQVRYFKDARLQMVGSIGEEATAALLSKSVFLVCIGSNDYLTNYFANPFRQISSWREKYTPDQFRSLLISVYEEALLEMHVLGAQKFAVVSLSAIGCIPLELQLQKREGGQCVSAINEEAQRFNQELFKLLTELNNIPAAQFVYLDAYYVALDVINRPAANGFRYTSTACCGMGRYNGIPICIEGISTVCQNASEFLFWDSFHPSQAANQIFANSFWTGQPPYVYPMNVKDLVSL